jgi:DNA-binding GntR family transcriptional regulator
MSGGSAEVRVSNGSSADAAYRELKSRLLAGDVPLGVRLGEERVAEQLSVSRTPVREALLRLYAEGFLERHPDGGFRVKHPTTRSVGELYDVRKALELYAVRLTLEALDGVRNQLEQLRDDWSVLEREAPDPDPEFVLIDEDFHQRLAEAAGNAELVEQLRRVNERIRPVRTHDFLQPDRIEQTTRQHLAIVEALLAGDSSTGTLLEAHICESQRVVEELVGRVLERMVGLGGKSW